MWELLRHTPIYREAWDCRMRHGPVPFDRNLSEFDDNKKLKAFVAKLKQPTDAISTYLNSKLTQTTRKQLANFNASKSRSRVAMQESLKEFLKSIIHGPSIYDTQRFNNVALRTETRRMIRRTRPRKGKKPKLKGEDLVHFNCLLLEDAYPSILRSGSGEPIWRLIGTARPSEDCDPDKSWLDLSEEQQDIIRQELPYLDPLGQIHNPAKSGHFKFEIDFVSLRREKGKQEEKLWSSSYAVIKSKPDSDWFPVFHKKGSEKKLLFLVFTFDERLGPKAITDQLKEFWQRVPSENTNSTESTKNIRKFLDQLRESEQNYRNHLEEVIASRLADNPEDSYAVDLQEYLRKESLVPWAKKRRQLREQMLKSQRDFKERVTKQRERHKLSRKTDWTRDPLLRHIRLTPSVQTPLCQLWFPVGLKKKQLLQWFEKLFRSHKRNRNKMAGMPLRLPLTGETGPPPILYSPPPRFEKTTGIQGTDKKGRLGFLWLGLTGHLIKKGGGQISKNSPTVIKLLKKNMATDLEAIKNASQSVGRLIKEIDTYWRPQISLPTSPPPPSIPNHNPNWLRERLFPYPQKV